MRIAMTRSVSSSMERCELTYYQRAAMDIALARAQHAAYEEALAGLGCKIISLPEAPDLPDAVFVEDAAVVLDEVAVITRPGAELRRAETGSLAQALEEFRRLARIEAPGTLDGGDVLRIGKNIYVGSSGRSSREGIEQMAAALLPFGLPGEGCAGTGMPAPQVGRYPGGAGDPPDQPRLGGRGKFPRPAAGGS